MTTTLCFFDGSCNPNPSGVMGWGWHVKDISENNGQIPKSRENSCNVAEYMAVYFLLEELRRLLDMEAISGHITINGDSNLVIRQMRGEWRVKNGMYKRWAIKSKSLLGEILQQHDVKIDFKWIPREQNERADELSKTHKEEEIHVSAEWLKITAKKMVEKNMITLEELVDYVMEVPPKI